MILHPSAGLLYFRSGSMNEPARAGARCARRPERVTADGVTR